MGELGAREIVMYSEHTIKLFKSRIFEQTQRHRNQVVMFYLPSSDTCDKVLCLGTRTSYSLSAPTNPTISVDKFTGQKQNVSSNRDLIYIKDFNFKIIPLIYLRLTLRLVISEQKTKIGCSGEHFETV